MTELRSELIAKRYRAERRFRFYGATALAVTAAFLAVLLVSIVWQGLPAFLEKKIQLEVTVDPAAVDAANPVAGDYDKLLREGLRTLFPEASSRVLRKALNGLISTGGSDDLRSRVVADPSLIGKTLTVPALLSDDADLYLKGQQTGVTRAPGASAIQIAPLEGEEGFLITGDTPEKSPEALPGQLVQAGAVNLRITAAKPGYVTAEALTPMEPAMQQLAAGQWQLVTLSVPEQDRRISDVQALWLEKLKAEGRVETGFNWRFFTAGDSREAELAGVRGALVGSLLTVAVALAFALPLGVAAAIYLEQFAPKNRFTDLIEVNINNLAAVPSIIFGLLGLAVFLNFFGLPRSAPLVGGLVLALLVLPTIIIASRAALKAVPQSITEAALGVGASKQQAVFQHVLPLALPGIMTGTILGLARAFGETAPLLMIGMVAFIADIPSGFTSAATALPVQVFLWSDLPEAAFKSKTAAAIIVLLVVLFALNAAAIYLRKRFERRW
ncbi:MAG: phosphate ABC transporter permease PstA [Aestuariivirga sp.]|uniref:phosphate ABC transporter permease PstA n=1 Tax=Aestuariivirga sp. TaxID=2650926 RepID=UPI0025C0B5B7|nr:phosphate ABC transporter permease PstA [Aestuariivirga sp.]MCA3559546.1 phosphate ABC transporter permease PstA [Aestuariivirga sp.]